MTSTNLSLTNNFFLFYSALKSPMSRGLLLERNQEVKVRNNNFALKGGGWISTRRCARVELNRERTHSSSLISIIFFLKQKMLQCVYGYGSSCKQPHGAKDAGSVRRLIVWVSSFIFKPLALHIPIFYYLKSDNDENLFLYECATPLLNSLMRLPG